MTIKEFEKVLAGGESQIVEFKSWVRVDSMKGRIDLIVDELIAFANSKGGTVFLGVEDDGTVTGCTGYDCQRIMEAIYDKTRPALFTEIEIIRHPNGDVLAVHVKPDGNTYATTGGKCLKRLGKNSKPYYPEEMSNKYFTTQNPDFSGRIISESSEEDINKLEVYSLKEKLRVRDSESTLPDLDDIAFLKDLGLIKYEEGIVKLTIAGLLFVGKEQSIGKLLPQAEVIYLHYSKENLDEYDARLDLKAPIISVIEKLSERIQTANRIVNVQVGMFRLEIVDFPEKVFQEALLNALAHRDYQNTSAVYVKHYPDKIVIENPGGFPEGINESNIITHPSVPRNKLIAETLQRLKYVQRTGQGVDIIFREMVSSGKPYPEYRSFNDAVTLTMYSAIDDVEFVKFIAKEQNNLQRNLSLSELMILRYLTDNRRVSLKAVTELVQGTREQAHKSCNSLIKDGLIEVTGKEYMLTAKMYEAMKASIEYTKDKSIQYIKAKEMILEYISANSSITNGKIQELCGFTKQQARTTLDKMRAEDLIEMIGDRKTAKYVKSGFMQKKTHKNS